MAEDKTEDQDPSPDKSAHEKIQYYVDLLPDLLDDFEKKHPKWDWEVTYWLLDWSLKSLRRYIEDSAEREISWRDPYVELHFPVDCSWDEEDSPLTIVSGTLSDKDVKDKKSATKALSKLLVKHLEVETLQRLTNYVALEKRGDSYTPLLSEEAGEALILIEDEDERQRELDKLLRPASFGAGSIDYGNLEEGQSIGSEIHEQLEAIEEPLISIPLEVDGNPIRVISIFEVHPLIVDPENRKAHFSIVAGLAIQSDADELPNEDWLDQPWTDFSKWDEEDRNTLWLLVDEFRKETVKILNEEPELEEAVVSVNAEIKVALPKGDRTKAFEAVQQATLSALQSTGEVMGLDFIQGSRKLLSSSQKQELENLLDLTLNAKSNDDKGNALEKLMAKLFSTVVGFSILENVRTESEEIDLWIENQDHTGSFRKEAELILVECKNWTTKCGKNEFELLRAKAMNRGKRCSLAFLISWNGFATTIAKELLRGSREQLLIVPIDGPTIIDAVRNGCFLDVLLDSKREALKT